MNKLDDTAIITMSADITSTYEYDFRGNITSIIKKDTYNNIIKSISLIYKQTGWIDQLTTAIIDVVA